MSNMLIFGKNAPKVSKSKSTPLPAERSKTPRKFAARPMTKNAVKGKKPKFSAGAEVKKAVDK